MNVKELWAATDTEFSNPPALEWAEKFAALVAAKEREECAKVCDDAISSIGTSHPWHITQVGKTVCTNLAARIRARGDK